MRVLHLPACLTLIALLTVSTAAIGRSRSDSLKIYKNTIRTNITNPMLFGEKYNVLGYERLLKNNQSVSVNTGRFTMPKFELYYSDSMSLENDYQDKGFTFAMDYRFYLQKENKYPGMHGVYIGPYYSYNYFHRDNKWDMHTSGFEGEVESEVKLSMNLIGFQAGYQFVLWNRLALDMIFFGPGVWFYKVSGKLSTTLSQEDENLIFDKLNEFLESRMPGRDFTLMTGSWDKNGSDRLASLGFRYLVNIGYRF
jgi:hypothetical protein